MNKNLIFLIILSSIIGCTQESSEKSIVNKITKKDSIQSISHSSVSKINKEIDSVIIFQEFDSLSIDSILPIPNAQFFSELDTNIADYPDVIGEYIKTYFSLTKPKEGTAEPAPNHSEYPEGGFCEFTTEFGRVSIVENNGCESYESEITYVFNNYSLEEVTKIIKTLLPKVSIEGSIGWYNEKIYSIEGNYYKEYYDNGACLMDIIQGDDKILVSYGCSC